MTSDLSHERVAELLLAYRRRELSGADAAGVKSHIETCDECRVELAGLSALLEPDIEPMTEPERAQLHAGIKAALDRPAAAVAPVVSMDDRRRQRWGRRAVQVLGVAAALVIVAVGASYLASGGDQLGDGGGTALEEAGGGAGGGAQDLSGPRPRFADSTAAIPEAASGGDASRTNKRNLQFFALADDLDRRGKLRNAGRSALFSRFARAYDAADAEELRPAFIDALVSGAGDARREVAQCTNDLIEASTGPIVPVFGSFTRFEGRSALVIGFIYTDREAGRLNRYTIWVWPRSSCDTPLSTVYGDVR